jgi:hypothetical protein
MLVVVSLSTVLVASAAAAATPLRNELADQFQLSRIEIQSASADGHVLKAGTVLRLNAEAIPANPFRSAQLNTKSPHFHVRDYAHVEVRRDGAIVAGPGTMSLGRGTELVVLDIKVSGDRIRLFTHTLNPAPLADGKRAHGCTEFVFVFDPTTMDGSDTGMIMSRIDGLLSRSSAS